MKVSKEDIIGVLTAVEHWFEDRDRAAERQEWYDDLEIIAERVAAGHGAGAELMEPNGVDRVPRLRVFGDRWQYPLEGLALRQQVLDGEPRIMLDDNSATENSIEIDPFQLQPGEAAQVGDAIAAVLREASRHEPAAIQPPETEIAGDWGLRVEFLQGSRVHPLNLAQHGPDLAAHPRS